MLQIIVWKNLSQYEQDKLLQRPALPQAESLQKTQQIIDAVRNEGDQAVKHFTQLYDHVGLDNFAVSKEEFNEVENKIEHKAKKAIEHAAEQVRRFHETQIPITNKISTTAGVDCELQYRSIEKVGFYVPGGTASLPSTALMLAIPAQIAGCKQRILCSPPQLDGTIDTYVLYAAKICGIEKIYKIGGAQAIAAMAFGTETVPKVYKIYGPGNSWVTQAKLLVAQHPQGAAFDLPAGPTEQMLIADSFANPEFAAADLLSQAEHSVDSQVFLLCDDPIFAEKVNQALEMQIATLPRKTIAEEALINSRIILVDDINTAIEIANDYAPEHLLLQVTDPRKYVDKINCAGSVFLGQWSPESVGDYASGTNHVLPTYGYGKSYSGLSLQDFMKRISFQELTAAGLHNIAQTVTTLASLEKLDAHKRAIDIRMESLRTTGKIYELDTEIS